MQGWDRPPFRESQSAGEFLFGKKQVTPPINGTDLFVKDFGETDYVDVSPENSNVLNSYFRKRLPDYFQYNEKERRMVAQLKSIRTQPSLAPIDPLTLDLGAPIWRGSSASVDRLARVFIAMVTVLFLIAPMFALAYIRPIGYILLAAALFSAFFGLVFALSSRARYHEVVGITAAYAAVLMVFVGNAIQGIQQGT